MKQNDLISQCLKIIGIANQAQNIGAFSRAWEYLVKLRELLNEQPYLEAGGANRTPESTDPH